MRKYSIKVTEIALSDIENVHDYIAYELFEPITADKYIRGIYDAMKHLTFYGISVAVSERDYLLSKYGSTVRNITCKKMSIVYTVENEQIVIQRIVAGALII
jgi:plasmid stabilization system protein ParE